MAISQLNSMIAADANDYQNYQDQASDEVKSEFQQNQTVEPDSNTLKKFILQKCFIYESWENRSNYKKQQLEKYFFEVIFKYLRAKYFGHTNLAQS